MNTEIEEETTVVSSHPEQVVKTTKTTDELEVPGEHPAKTYQKKKAIFRTYQIIWYILGIVEVLLGFRVLLKMLGANSASGFANFIYSLSDPLALPFYGVVRTTVTGPSVLEWSTLLAMVVYFILSYGLIELLQFVKPVTKEEVEENVSSQ